MIKYKGPLVGERVKFRHWSEPYEGVGKIYAQDRACKTVFIKKDGRMCKPGGPQNIQVPECDIIKMYGRI